MDYLAPDVWDVCPYYYKFYIWSLGYIIYKLCCLVPPFRGTNFKELIILKMEIIILFLIIIVKI